MRHSSRLPSCQVVEGFAAEGGLRYGELSQRRVGDAASVDYDMQYADIEVGDLLMVLLF